MNSAYETLQSLHEAGAIKLYHIVAPPRSSSTALERALSNSPDIDLQINDAWSLFDHDRERQTYDYIVERIGNVQPSERPYGVLLKSIADYIPPGEAWDRMTKVTDYTVFLIREPVVAMESLMKVMALELPPDDAYAKNRGYDSWQAMNRHVQETGTYQDLEALFLQSFPGDQAIHADPEMQLPVFLHTPVSAVQQLGFDTHDAYAHARGYSSWQELQTKIITGGALPANVSDLDERNFLCRITGWSALAQHYGNRPAASAVMDSTLFRLFPLKALAQLSAKLGIQSSSRQVRWGGNGKEFSTDYDGAVPYYNRVSSSIGVQPPTEKPPLLSVFPKFIRKQLLSAGGPLEIYMHMLSQSLADFPDIASEDIPDYDPIFQGVLARLQGHDQQFEAISEAHKQYSDIFNTITAISQGTL